MGMQILAGAILAFLSLQSASGHIVPYHDGYSPNIFYQEPLNHGPIHPRYIDPLFTPRYSPGYDRYSGLNYGPPQIRTNFYNHPPPPYVVPGRSSLLRPLQQLHHSNAVNTGYSNAATLNHHHTVIKEHHQPPSVTHVKKTVVEHSNVAPIHAPLEYLPPPLVYPNVKVAVDVPVVISQYHKQDDLGRYSFGYNGDTSSKHESKDANGVVTGTYSYQDPYGQIQTQEYIADADGFRVTGTNLPVGPARKKRSAGRFPAATGPLGSFNQFGHIDSGYHGHYLTPAGYRRPSSFGYSFSHTAPTTSYISPYQWGYSHW